MKPRMVAIALALVLPACGGGPNSPTSSIPNCAGNYSGPVAWTVDGSHVATLTMRINVVQAGSQLTITGSLTIDGQTSPMTAMTGNVNATGYFSMTSGGATSFSDPTCGAIAGIDGSLTFSGNTARYVERDSTQFCGTWVFSGTLTR